MRFELGVVGETSVLRRFSRVPRQMPTESGQGGRTLMRVGAVINRYDGGICGGGDSVSLGLGRV